jgi:hypothetical protein
MMTHLVSTVLAMERRASQEPFTDGTFVLVVWLSGCRLWLATSFLGVEFFFCRRSLFFLPLVLPSLGFVGALYVAWVFFTWVYFLLEPFCFVLFWWCSVQCPVQGVCVAGQRKEHRPHRHRYGTVFYQDKGH